jgi:putative transposase
MAHQVVKDWYTVQELAGLPGMPGTDRGVRKWAEKNLSASRTKVRGKGREYAFKSLPTETQSHLTGQAIAAVLADLPAAVPVAQAAGRGVAVVGGTALAAPATPAPTAGPRVRLMAPAPGEVLFDGSTTADREQALAIKMVLSWVADVRERGQLSVKAAAHTLLNAARAGMLTPEKVALLRVARDKRGRPSADGLPSVRSIEQWLALQSAGLSLVPRKPQPDMTLQRWHVVALEFKRRPQKPTTKMVHEQLVANWTPLWGAQPPSYDQVAYFFRQKYSQTDLMVGQHLGSALAAKRAYHKRSTDGLDPFVEVHADGWNTHFSAPHPVTGEFVTLEVWHFHELVTRYVTKPAIGLSESMAVILSGLENYIRELGVPAVWQTDSTGSVKNKTVKDDPLVSIAARAGISIVHPVKVGNSQANGIAENWNTWIDRESRELATYQHPQRMDPLAFKQVRKFTDKMVKAAKAGDTEGREQAKRAAQHAGKGLVFESFAQAQDWINAKVLKFNTTPHSSLPRMTDPTTGQRRHQTPLEAKDAAIAAGFEPMWMDDLALMDLFRIHVKRRVLRGMVSPYLRQEYHHADMAQVEGQDVMVAVDIMDGTRVWVKDLGGRLICEAPVVAVTGYRAMSFYEMSLTKRMTAQIKRKEQQIEVIQDRMDPARMPLETPALEVHGAQVLDFGPRGLKPLQTVAEVLTQSAPALPEAALVTQAAPDEAPEPTPEEPPKETPGEALMRWYAEEAERAVAAEEALQAQSDGPDRLFLMMRAEQDERERQEEEAAERRRAMGGE